jgi:hypothetical protein
MRKMKGSSDAFCLTVHRRLVNNYQKILSMKLIKNLFFLPSESSDKKGLSFLSHDNDKEETVHQKLRQVVMFLMH